MKEYVLNNGIRIPAIGLGTFLAKDGEETYQAVLAALRAGYRHIDTAARYGNEETIGKAIKDSGVARDELFVTTKLWNDVHTYEGTKASIEASLKKLDLEYLDLYLIHWPNPESIRETTGWQARNHEVWRAMEDMVAEGKIRAIGVSNFMPHHLESLLETARVVPAVNQIRLAPGVFQTEIVEFCRKQGILLEAWGPFGQGELFSNKVIQNMAVKYDTTVAQLALAWSLQEGFLPLPKSVTPERIASNLDVFGIELSPQDMEILKELPVEQGSIDPDQTNF